MNDNQCNLNNPMMVREARLVRFGELAKATTEEEYLSVAETPLDAYIPECRCSLCFCSDRDGW